MLRGAERELHLPPALARSAWPAAPAGLCFPLGKARAEPLRALLWLGLGPSAQAVTLEACLHQDPPRLPVVVLEDRKQALPALKGHRIRSQAYQMKSLDELALSVYS